MLDRAAYQREWYRNHLGWARERGRSRYHAERVKLLDLLGPFCSVCGEDDMDILTLDHVAPVRKNPGERQTGGNLLGELRNGRENPFNLQVLCANCHLRKSRSEKLSFRLGS